MDELDWMMVRVVAAAINHIKSIYTVQKHAKNRESFLKMELKFEKDFQLSPSPYHRKRYRTS